MKSDFNAGLVTIKGVGEVALFIRLQQLLSKNYPTTYIHKAHQHYVEFKSVYAKKIVKREISDLWVIVYSKQKMQIRTTFLQAKFEKEYKLSNNSFKFKGDFFQHELLSKRPLISDKSGLNLPDDILHDTIFSSIGSYGIFYLDQNNLIDFAYSIAENIVPCSDSQNPKKPVRVLSFDSKTIDYYAAISGSSEIELISTLSLDKFIYDLIDLKIGAEMHLNSSFLKYVPTQLKKFGTLAQVSDFLAFARTLQRDARDNDDVNSGVNSNMSILLVQVDDNE